MLFAGTVAGAFPTAAQDSAPLADMIVSCLLLPWETVDVAAAIDGIVAEVRVERGDRVQAGQLLVRLDDEMQRAYFDTVQARAEDTTAVRQAEIRVNVASSSLERNRPLFERQQMTADQWEQIRGAYDVALIELDAARSALHQAELEVTRAQAALNQTAVYSPSEAVVLDRLVSVGERSGVEPLVKLAVIKRLRGEIFALAQSYTSWVPGDAVGLSVENPSPHLVEGRIRTVDPVSDAGTGVIGVLVEVDNADGSILAGQQCALAGPASMPVPDAKG